MSEIHTVQLLQPTGALETLTIKIAREPPWTFTVSGPTFGNREFEERDLFEALAVFRQELDETGACLLVSGARIDVFPSGMSRSMGGGRKAYITRLGEQATEVVDIFSPAEPGLVGSVDQQRQFHDQWIQSLRK